MVAEGIYYLTAKVTDSSGNLYTDTVAITVLPEAYLDGLLRGKWEAMRAKLAEQIRDSLKEAEKNLEALKKERERSILGEIVEKEKAISVPEGEFTKASRRSQLERLYSPVNGTVHGLATHTIGGVVTSAQPIITIVPDGTPLIVEALALNQDIGFIQVGQKAELKLDTFPFQKYGTIEAELSYVSPDAQEDQKIGLVYKIKLKPKRFTIRVRNKDVPLSPGMAVTAEIKRGERRVILNDSGGIIQMATIEEATPPKKTLRI
jgi:hemolysin D